MLPGETTTVTPGMAKDAPVTQFTPTPTIYLVVDPPKTKAQPVGVSWRQGTSKEVPGMSSIVYRFYPTKDQLDGTMLDSGCHGFNTSSSFDSVLSNRPWKFHIPANNLVHSVLKTQHKEIPNMSFPNRRAKSKRTNSCYLSQEIGEETLYRLKVDFLPESVVGLDGCHVQNLIAQRLGGVRAPASHNNGMRSLWHFQSRGLALDHLALSVLCTMGDIKYYKKLKGDVMKEHAKLSQSSTEQGGDVAIVGYPMESHATNPSGVIGYYLIASNDKNTDGYPQLVVAIPSRYHSKLRANGPVTKRVLGKGDTTSFFCLL